GAADAAKGAKDTAGQGLDAAKGVKLPGGAGGAAAGDPDGDGTRAQAKDAKPNEPITDEVDPAKKDLADWRVFDLQGKPGMLTVQLHWDTEESELGLDVFDSFGANIAASPGKGPQPAKRVLAQIEA